MAGLFSRRRFVTSSVATALATSALPVLPASLVASPNLAAEVVRAVRGFVAALSPSHRKRTVFALDDPRRLDWHYIPRRRPGVTIGDMNDQERRALWYLLGAILSPRGNDQVRGVIKLERTLGELTGNLAFRDPGDYAIVIFGDPAGAAPFAWRFEGHHLSLSVLLLPGVGLSVSPNFVGANPATVPGDHKHAGFRLFGEEEDRAFGLVRSLEGAVRSKALIANRSLGDIVSGPGREDDLKQFEGAPLSQLSEGQKAGVYAILQLYAGTMRDEIAAAVLKRVRSDGADRLHFAWAGSLKPGQPHYFRIHRPSVLVEYDNTQNGANHVHSVWIDPLEVFGRDLLRGHHKKVH